MELAIGKDHVLVDGCIVERDALRIAEAIKAYDPNLELLCLNRVEAIDEAPFVIAEHCKDGVLRPVFSAWKLDDTVLHRIVAADGQKANQLAVIEQGELKIKKERERRYKEEMHQAHDVAAHVIANKKSKYTVRDSNTGDLLTFYDDRPTTRC